MGIPVERVLAKLTGVIKSGSGWKARCPTHNDDVPSLKIDTRADGAVLLTCHGGCSTKAVLNALGLRFSDLFASPPPAGWHPRSR